MGGWHVVALARIRTKAALRRRLALGCWLLAVRTDCLPLQQLHLFPQPLANSRLIAEPGGNHLMHAGVGFDRLFRADCGAVAAANPAPFHVAGLDDGRESDRAEESRKGQ